MRDNIMIDNRQAVIIQKSYRSDTIGIPHHQDDWNVYYMPCRCDECR